MTPLIEKRLPAAAVLVKAIDGLDSNTVTPDLIQDLLKQWPDEDGTSFDDLLSEAKSAPTTKWEKNETYFIELGKKKQFHGRLTMFQFMLQFDATLATITTKQQNFLAAFQSLRTTSQLKTLLGAILKFGNCMNAGNENRCRADGFVLDALAKTQTFKDENQVSILHTICKTLSEADPTFKDFKSHFDALLSSAKYDINDTKAGCDKLAGEIEGHLSRFESLKKADPAITGVAFGQKVPTFLKGAQGKVNEVLNKQGQVREAYGKTCDYFMLEKDDEKRTKSDKFCKFFADYFEDAHRALAAKEQPTTRASATSPRPRPGGAARAKAAFLGELMAQQAAKK